MWSNDDNKKNLKQMPIKEILFDSREHNWKINKVESDKKTKEHKDLMFVIEDTNGNGFGGYCSKKLKLVNFILIQIVSYSHWKETIITY